LNPSELGRQQLKQRDGEPMFKEPWQAQVLAMADLLVQSETISKANWAETLGNEISAAKAAGNPDDTETYFRAALTALEQLLISRQKVSSQELTVRLDEWEHAHLRTPHGQPVVLNQS
jgi:nitrile hydratase accessory protein